MKEFECPLFLSWQAPQIAAGTQIRPDRKGSCRLLVGNLLGVFWTSSPTVKGIVSLLSSRRKMLCIGFGSKVLHIPLLLASLGVLAMRLGLKPSS